jgi:hypothetical protein
MGVILGSLGIILSLAAIWMTSEALRRTDGKGEALIRPHVRDIKLRIADNQNLLTQLDNRLVDIERQIGVLKSDRLDTTGLAEQVDAVRYGLDKARSFRPSTVYNA